MSGTGLMGPAQKAILPKNMKEKFNFVLWPYFLPCVMTVLWPYFLPCVMTVFSTLCYDRMFYLVLSRVQKLTCPFPIVTMTPASRGWNSAATTVSVAHLQKTETNIFNQTLANRGHNSWFVFKAIIKGVMSKSSRSSIRKILNCAYPIHPIQPNLS